jgi:hypothetical protein
MTATRSWRQERVTWSRDTTGRPVPLLTDITRDERGQDVAEVRMSGAPPLETPPDLLERLRRDRRADRPPRNAEPPEPRRADS